jgi:hypothetical protein
MYVTKRQRLNSESELAVYQSSPKKSNKSDGIVTSEDPTIKVVSDVNTSLQDEHNSWRSTPTTSTPFAASNNSAMSKGTNKWIKETWQLQLSQELILSSVANCKWNTQHKRCLARWKCSPKIAASSPPLNNSGDTRTSRSTTKEVAVWTLTRVDLCSDEGMKICSASWKWKAERWIAKIHLQNRRRIKTVMGDQINTTVPAHAERGPTFCSSNRWLLCKTYVRVMIVLFLADDRGQQHIFYSSVMFFVELLFCLWGANKCSENGCQEKPNR